MHKILWLTVIGGSVAMGPTGRAGAADFIPIRHNKPGLIVDLGVGLWALPVPTDYDGDGDYDLLVSTVNKASPGLYFFENPGGDTTDPVFRPAVRVADAHRNLTPSYPAGKLAVLSPGMRYRNIRTAGLKQPQSIPYKPTFHRGRADQWSLCDFDGDGIDDLIIGASDWREYGWDNAYDAQGRWTNGPLHGYVYFMKNLGSADQPRYAEAMRLRAGDAVLDVYGCPSPNFADFDGDGDLDLICGEFLDKLTYFENVGTRTEPRYAKGRTLQHGGRPITLDLQMLRVVAFDWDRDEDIDLIVGQEDGRVALVENTGRMSDGAPAFLAPRFFRQQADRVKCGALVTPYSADFDDDGDEDLICGDTAGYVSWIENLDGGNPPAWSAPRYLEAGGEVIRIQAGVNGSIQGPAEAKWGYTVPCVADWNGDGRLDILINSIWGKVMWFENIGSRAKPELAAARPIEVNGSGDPIKPAWNWWSPTGKQLVTQWRTSPVVKDLNRDGLNDLIMLDHEGYLAFFERRMDNGVLRLLPGRRIFQDESGKPLRLNERQAGKSGRRKLVMTDWDGDGRLDLLVNSKSVDFLRNVSDDGGYRFRNLGPVAERALAGHTTCPTVVDWDRNGTPDLLVGAEDGFLYYHYSAT